MENNQKEISLAFSFTDEIGETIELKKTFTDNSDIGSITWLLDEFKYFLRSLSFPQEMTDNIIYLNMGDKVVDMDGETIFEREPI